MKAPWVTGGLAGLVPKETQGFILPIFAISAVLNVLMLSGSFFMLMVYDDVLPSHSIPTLISLLVMVTLAYGFQAALDLIRARAMIQIGAIVDRKLASRVFDVLSNYERTNGPMQERTMPLRDLDQVRSYLASPGPTALLDLPWVILYLGVLFAFHWAVGVVTLLGLCVLIVLTILANRVTEEGIKDLSRLASARANIADTSQRNAEVIRALGMTGRLRNSWSDVSDRYLTANDELSTVAGRMQGLSKSFRMLLQSIILAVGAGLVIYGEATGGIIIASSILSSRALAPVEQTIASWKAMISMRQASERLSRILFLVPNKDVPLELPRPDRQLEVRNLYAGPPGQTQPTITDISFRVGAGEVVAIVGPSGSGKSTLVRALTGIWPSMRGDVRLDGAALDQWAPDTLGEYVGYVPQQIELFEGTVAQNIARFEPGAAAEKVIAAAQAADVHDLVVSLPQGYDTYLGAGGGDLSAGQKQRIALARALYGDPFLIVMDEPNSNLDATGEAALNAAIQRASERKAVVIIVAHRASALASAHYVIALAKGRVNFGGRRDEVLAKLREQSAATPAPLTSGGNLPVSAS